MLYKNEPNFLDCLIFILVNGIYEKSISIQKLYGKGLNDVHYNNKGYEKLGKLITRFLKKQL